MLAFPYAVEEFDSFISDLSIVDFSGPQFCDTAF